MAQPAPLKQPFERVPIFTNVRFDGLSDFEEATSSNLSCLIRQSFKEALSFNGATFIAMLRFPEIRISGRGSFIGATFKSSATFSGTIFKQYASFNHVQFERADRFSGHATFRNLYTLRKRVFNVYPLKPSMRAEFFGLSYATFYKVPDFSQAHVSEAPDVDYLKSWQRLPLLA